MAELNYKQDGTGRDTYIYKNNGGFSIMNQGVTFPQPGTFLPKVNKSPHAGRKYAHANQMAKSPVYRVDGTGRDSYVQYRNGGFAQPSSQSHNFDSRIQFRQALRSYEPDPDYLKRRGIDQSQKVVSKIGIK